MKNLLVRLILTYLKFFARLALIINKPQVIGITGSAGKTSTRDAVYAVLKDSFKTHEIKKGNSETGIPLGILGLQVKSLGFDSFHKSLFDWSRLLVQAPRGITFLKGVDYLIVEMGVDDPFPPKNMGYLLTIVKPHISIVLNVHNAHAEQFEKVVEPPVTDEKITRAIAQEKCKIVTNNQQCTYAIYNKDNSFVSDILDKIDLPKATFGSTSDNNISFVDYSVTTDKTLFAFRLQSKQSYVIEIQGYALPLVYQEVLSAAILVGLHTGLDLKQIKASLEKNYTLEPGRSSILKGIDDSIIIDSSYNGPHEGMRAMLALAYELKKSTKRPLVCVIGDMRELGLSSKQKHHDIAHLLEDYANYVYTVGPLSEEYIYNVLKGNKRFRDIQAFINPHDAGKYLKKNPVKGAIFLFKGSQNTIFLEEAIKYILADAADSQHLSRQEDYWMRKKQFTLLKKG